MCDWAKQWVQAYKNNKEIRTQEVYDYTLKYINNEEYGIGSYKLIDIKPIIIQNFISSMTQKGLTRTVEMVYNTLRQLFSQTKINNLIYTNPMEEIKLDRFKVLPKQAISDEDVKKIISAKIPLENKCIVFFYVVLWA